MALAISENLSGMVSLSSAARKATWWDSYTSVPREYRLLMLFITHWMTPLSGSVWNPVQRDSALDCVQ